MNFYKRIFSTLLAVIMLLGALSGLSINVGAAADTESDSTEDKIKNAYLGQSYNTPEEKLASMTMMLERDGYQLWVDPMSGEVATKELATGNIMFSNPYDVAGSDVDIQNNTQKNGAAATQQEILSQLVVRYKDTKEGKATTPLYSFTEAVLREQVSVVNIKNGVRIEYTIGREESRKLVPRRISEENFIKFIQTPLADALANGEINNQVYKQFNTFYTLKSLDAEPTPRAKQQLLDQYEVCAYMNIYVLDLDIKSYKLNELESYIKTYCEDYSFEQMDADHAETKYEEKNLQFPVFKMALEYSFENGALIVRLPCNGLRYDMTSYTLESVQILPYFGAGNSKNPGYNFYPDGSGTLFDFDTEKEVIITNPVYGDDYAYQELGNLKNRKAIRYPVYGTVATETIYTFTYRDEADGKIHNISVSNTVMDKEEIEEWLYLDKNGKKVDVNRDGIIDERDKQKEIISEITEETYKRGYVAVIESGDALATIQNYQAGGQKSPYNTVMNNFKPVPYEELALDGALTVTGSNTYTALSNRKYTGNIKIRYQMLSDETRGQNARKEDPSYKYYEASWLGMAEAYRDHLIAKGVLTKLDEEDVQPDIPLYMESFGALLVQKVIATMPMDVMTPLTTFDNISAMYKELSDRGVKNINFKMTGFANGGMYYTVPSALEWEDAVGGKDGFEDLVEESKEINGRGDGYHMGLFPDFDFAYIQSNSMSDDTDLKEDAVKTLNKRYTSLRQYSATLQTYVSFYQLAVSPSRYGKFYKQLLKSYQEYGLNTMSVGTLGSSLNSDFDEKDSYNREDNKEHTKQAFSYLQNAGYSLMTDKGNAYTWSYVDHLINVDLDSSRYVASSASVPFIGAVLHGYIEFTGTPFNKEGDTDYAILRAIENGAGIYFVLSYQNTAELKEDVFLSQHYSVQYDIWRDDVISYYNQLNGLLKDVQTKEIIAHQFLEGSRVLDRDELLNNIEQSLKDAIEEELKKQETLENEQIVAVGDAWQVALNAKGDIEALIAQMNAKNDELLEEYNKVVSAVTPVTGGAQAAFEDALKTIWEKLDGDANDGAKTLTEEDIVKLQGMLPDALKTMQKYINGVKDQAAKVYQRYEEQKLLMKKVYAVIAKVEAASDVIANSNMSDEVKTNLKNYIASCLEEAKKLVPDAEALVDVHIGLMDDSKSTSVINVALTVPDAVAPVDSKNSEWLPFVPYVKDVCDGYYIGETFYEGCTYFTAEDVLASVKLDEGKTEEEVEDSFFDRYHVDNNQIVAVTYGDRDFNTYGVKTAYKTFILNYNTFAVFVEYNNVKYTIPSGGYVVIYH